MSYFADADAQAHRRSTDGTTATDGTAGPGAGGGHGGRHGPGAGTDYGLVTGDGTGLDFGGGSGRHGGGGGIDCPPVTDTGATTTAFTTGDSYVANRVWSSSDMFI